MKIFDCFQFFNELDLLEIRLELLYEHVDYFVISESNRTHSNELKELFFMKNKNKFEKYIDKIIHVHEDLPEDVYSNKMKEPDSEYNKIYNKIIEIFDSENEGGLKEHPTFARDYLQREFIKLGLISCDENDIILVSDLDEIPNPNIVDKIKKEKLINHCIMMDCHNFYVNNLCHTNWLGNYSVLFSQTKDSSLTHLRNLRYSFEKLFDSGWHLSYLGGLERIKTKIKSYSHQEYNTPDILENIEKNIKMNKDLFGRTNSFYSNEFQEYFFESMKFIDLENYTYPKKILDLIENKFPYLIKK